MTHFEIERLPFKKEAVNNWGQMDPRHSNWPVVYVLDEKNRSAQLDDVYVGESLNAASRMRQHLDSAEKQHLSTIRVIIDETFNKSVCLDLESYLIRMLAGDGAYRVLNRNDGITESDYFDRDKYRQTFREVFEELKNEGVFTRTIPEIENSDLFKLSPFKALTPDQGAAVEDILEGLFEDLASGGRSTIVIQGDPGTGKTVIAIYMLKLLADIAKTVPADDFDSDTVFAEFFTSDNRDLLRDARIGLVVPQQSLRQSIKKVFGKTPGLTKAMVLTPFDVGASDSEYDLLIVDETHRLNQRANQPSGPLNKLFRDITVRLFGADDSSKTQLDWIRAKSKHQVFLVDAAQSVKPADLPKVTLERLISETKASHRFYPLVSQMRVQAGADYVGYIRKILGDSASTAVKQEFGGYDLRLFNSLPAMREQIIRRDAEVGLSRMLAGYAWEWKTKNDKTAFDIEVDGLQLRWNGTQTDWIASLGSLDEVGSIHTVQGYDLNYAGVIIGPDLRFDEASGQIIVDRSSYFDKKGMENNRVLGTVYTDEDLLVFIRNIYAVLLTRGVLGTYLYVVDAALRAHLSRFFPRG
jgi:uncharacterized protein